MQITAKKPTLIMIHGFRGTHHGLVLIAEQFRKQYNVIVPDLPGFGAGDIIDSHDLDSYVAWLQVFIKKQRLTEKPLLLGHSFGSIVTSAYAAKHPKMIEKLILVNPIGAPALEGQQRVLTNLAIFYYKLGEKLPEKLGRRWLGLTAVTMIMSISMAKTDDKKLRKYIHSQHRQYFSTFHSAKSVSEGFRTSVSHDVSEFAPKIKIPTLLIAGALDDVTHLSKQFALVKLFSNAKLSVIDGVGHLTHYEKPVVVANIIKRWLKSAASATYPNKKLN